MIPGKQNNFACAANAWFAKETVNNIPTEPRRPHEYLRYVVASQFSENDNPI